MSRVRGLVFGICSALALCAAPPALATNLPGAEWTPLNDLPASQVTLSNTNEIGLARSADGVLHVLWVNDRDNGTQALLHTPMTGTAPSTPGVVGAETTVLTANPNLNQVFNDNVDLLAVPGGIRALFARTNPGGAADGTLSTAVSATGAAWSAPDAVSATAPAQRHPVYAAGGVSGATGITGTTYSTWGDSSPDGGGFHVGLSPATPDQIGSPFTPACCEIDPAIAVDTASGEVMVAANRPDTAIRVRSLTSGKTYSVPKSAHAWTQQRTSISGRIGGSGVYVAWGTGDNMFNARPAIWRVGAPKFLFLKKQFDAAHVGMTPAPNGRLWVYWDRDGKIYASRTNKTADHFGAIVKVPGALNSETFFGLDGEGSLGQLDLFALTETGGNLNWWAERIAPGLTVDCDSPVKQGAKLKCKVLDAGDPVSGIEVYSHLGNKKASDISNSQGKVKLKIPGDAPKGKHKAYTADDADWSDGRATYKVIKG